ncbi:hypothetical protein [Leptospira mayottensis]|uniref:hypothetical protein n=1 Tax=Leptospira mayottensis TaxID=1137606 RepID=UPI000E35F599|nr:hypothetical protein [Leptospira mayottensis]AXR68328.1 hypothetical protein DPV73_10130 [Leptospira mayottensis]
MNDNFEILTPKEHYIRENFSEFNARYSGTCKNLYKKISSEIPQIFKKLNFYRNFRDDDSFAECLNDNLSFVIQLDPDCEVIVLFNGKMQMEFGVWGETKEGEVEDLALDFIKENFLNFI